MRSCRMTQRKVVCTVGHKLYDSPKWLHAVREAQYSFIDVSEGSRRGILSVVEMSFSNFGNWSSEQVVIQKLDFNGTSQVIILEYLQRTKF
jgi:hypothetical protein